jgi:hypothetical protein
LRTERSSEAVAASGFVGQHQQEEVLVRHFLLAAERESVGKCIEDGRELQTSQYSFEIGRDDISGAHGYLRISDRLW